ncbi:MAG TPA: hypothetical protein VNN80_10920 [Polyangiaceae bacterium]|nr:hypothetical protein [Polyangiaceae bacterium]HWP06543.1 hypothetical protein [Polyangiaceae bacterium]
MSTAAQVSKDRLALNFFIALSGVAGVTVTAALDTLNAALAALDSTGDEA